ncbi:hypothetical protein DN752_13190 [Echinicola strongylocentroti]|uniref:Uncharacterized protein n=1 Tax=Echinicola strongylocentroti TaxID=1795355 RepID=A0A2Z4IJY7_9BACT|nr:hypothetical protein DN752_13190 [Echinicola strongylocentroti]
MMYGLHMKKAGGKGLCLDVRHKMKDIGLVFLSGIETPRSLRMKTNLAAGPVGAPNGRNEAILFSGQETATPSFVGFAMTDVL